MALAVKVVNKPKKTSTLAPTIDDKDLYKYVLDTRNFEISMFWQRSNYFLVLNTGLAIGFFNIECDVYAFCLACFGFLASYFWYQVNLGGKYWQTRWEHKLALIEKQIAPGLECFCTTQEITDNDVRQSLGPIPQDSSFFKRVFHDQIQSKPSVSHHMILLSVLFIIAWTALIVTKITSLFK